MPTSARPRYAAWLTELHSIPVQCFGYLDGRGVGKLATMDESLAELTSASTAFKEAGCSVGIPVTTIRLRLHEITDAFRAAPPRVALIHNDLVAQHVMAHDRSFSGIIDFGEVAAEPAANDFAKWDFVEGERFPVEWIQDGYGNPSLFQPPNDRTYQALWLGNGLWRLRWYHERGFGPGAEGPPATDSCASQVGSRWSSPVSCAAHSTPCRAPIND